MSWPAPPGIDPEERAHQRARWTLGLVAGAVAICIIGLFLALGTLGGGSSPSSSKSSAGAASGGASSPARSGAASSPPASPTTSAAGQDQFTSPSGNISCVLDGTGARCDIRQRDWAPPPKPADCKGDFGQGLMVSGSKPGSVVCASDTVLGNQPPLAYGSNATAGPITCTSSQAGVRCENTTTKHGFQLARESYQVF